jgi:hypothetical protein
VSTKQRKREIRKCKKLGIPIPYKVRRRAYGCFDFWSVISRIQEFPVRRTRVSEIPENLVANRFVKNKSTRTANAEGYGDWGRSTCLRRSGSPAEGFKATPRISPWGFQKGNK